MPEGSDLAERLARLADGLGSEADPGAVLDEILAAAVDLVPGAEEASISLVVARRLVTSPHRTGELSGRVDAVQTQTGEGPVVDAAFEQQTVRVPDVRDERRWPEFARRAYEAGAGSMLTFQLYVQGDSLAVLNLYNRGAGAFGEESEEVGLAFARHAAQALVGAHEHGDLALAVASRDLIGQAEGMLMERFRIDGDGAFRVLAQASRSTDRRLKDVAQELVSTGNLALPPET